MVSWFDTEIKIKKISIYIALHWESNPNVILQKEDLFKLINKSAKDLIIQYLTLQEIVMLTSISREFQTLLEYENDEIFPGVKLLSKIGYIEIPIGIKRHVIII